MSTHSLVISFFGLFLILQSCKKPGIQPEEFPEDNRLAVVEVISGDSQKGIYGEVLNDSIVLRVFGHGNDSKWYDLQYRMRKGNGEIQTSYSSGYADPNLPDSDGYMKIDWKLGCNANEQIVDVLLYVNDMDDFSHDPKRYDGRRPDDSLTIRAEAIRPSGWGKACGCGNVVPDAKVLSSGNELYMINNTLYTSMDGGYNWQQIPNLPDWGSIRLGQISNKGWFYIVTDNSEVYYTKDFETWQPIHTGVSSLRAPDIFLVSGETILIHYPATGLFRSEDNGVSWEEISIPSFYEHAQDLLAHPSGQLYLLTDYGEFFTSEDNGKHWKMVFTDLQYYGAASSFNIDKNGLLYTGYPSGYLFVVTPNRDRGTIFPPKKEYHAVTNINFRNNEALYLLQGESEETSIYVKNITNWDDWEKTDLDFHKAIQAFYINSDGDLLFNAEQNLYVHY